MPTVDTPILSALTGLPPGAPRPAPPGLTPTPLRPLRGWIGPGAMMLTTPLLAVLVWLVAARFDGSIRAALDAGPAVAWSLLPGPTARAAAIVAGWALLQLALLVGLPGEVHEGPITPAGVRPTYRLNGVAAWVVSHAALVGGWWAGIVPAGRLYDLYGEVLVTLNLGALALCAFLYVKGRRWPSSPDAVWTGQPLFDFFQGIELHPRVVGVNLKQWINCRVSMMGWSATFVAMAMAQVERTGHLSTSMAASVTVLVVYLFKFFWWESGYFHSLDIMHDRFGYYIAWGVLVWVPSVYCAPALWLVDHPIALHPVAALATVAFGLAAIAVNYDADAQRQRVRRTNGQTTVWGKPPELIHATYTTADGRVHDSILLVSGWWGVARHFHYVPELALAFAWTVPAGFTHLLPWTYWLFLFVLLMDRARRDELRCAKKYGAAWEAYTARVRWRVLPGVY